MDANDRRNEWLARQYASDSASDPVVMAQAATKLLGTPEEIAHAAALAAAQAAVVKAAMDAWRAGAFGTRSLEDMVANAACADLAALEGK